MRCAVITTSLIMMSLILLASFVYAETTFSDNPDEFMINPPVSAPASVQQTETGGHGSRTANTTAPPTQINCSQGWICGDWSSCASGFQTRACADSNDCDNLHMQGNVSKVIAAQKPAESRDCKETSLPKVETPALPAEAPTQKQQTALPICRADTVKLAISPIVSAIALLAIIAIIFVKAYLRRKGDYIIVYLHRDKQQNNKFYIKKGYGNNFQNDKRQSRNNSLK